MHNSVRLWCIIVLCLAIATWILCIVFTTSGRHYVSVSVTGNFDPEPVWLNMAKNTPEGFEWSEFHIWGVDIETVHDWYGHLPTVRSGIPGGRWTLVMGVFLVTSSIGLLLSILSRKHLVTVE